MATKKTASRKSSSKAGRFEGTVVERSMKGINKAFLAYIGLADQVRTNLGTKFDELAADGEKVRNRAQKSADEVRKEAVNNAKTARKNVEKRIETTVETFLARSPVATSTDVKKLNAKLDKVLAQVGK